MRRLAQPRKNLPLRDQRPKIYNPFVAVVEGDLQHALDDRLRVDDARQLLHSMRSTFPCAIAASKRSSSASLRGAAQERTLARFAVGSHPAVTLKAVISITARCSAIMRENVGAGARLRRTL